MEVDLATEAIGLDPYLDTAGESTLKASGLDWKHKAKALDRLATALNKSAEEAELRIGEKTLSGPALRKAMEGAGGRCVFTSEWDRFAQATYNESYSRRCSHNDLLFTLQ